MTIHFSLFTIHLQVSCQFFELFTAVLHVLEEQTARRLVFVIGGPYGFSPEVYARANEMLSLSRLTFSHQMVRLVFTEQLYRACTIIKGEPYHHE